MHLQTCPDNEIPLPIYRHDQSLSNVILYDTQGRNNGIRTLPADMNKILHSCTLKPRRNNKGGVFQKVFLFGLCLFLLLFAPDCSPSAHALFKKILMENPF